jgi:hypothetical protein
VENHAFNFDGGLELSKMGATWFVSYAYYRHIDPTHNNWEKVKTHLIRANMFDNTTTYHKYWLKQIAEMNDNKLNTNEIELQASRTKEMARKLLNLYKQASPNGAGNARAFGTKFVDNRITANTSNTVARPHDISLRKGNGTTPDNTAKISKSKAVNIVNKKRMLNLNNGNTAFSNIGTNQPYWGFTIDNANFTKDYYLIMHEDTKKTLYLFNIKRNSIDPRQTFLQRNDKDSSTININVAYADFADRHSGFKFKEYLVDTIVY